MFLPGFVLLLLLFVMTGDGMGRVAGEGGEIFSIDANIINVFLLF